MIPGNAINQRNGIDHAHSLVLRRGRIGPGVLDNHPQSLGLACFVILITRQPIGCLTRPGSITRRDKIGRRVIDGDGWIDNLALCLHKSINWVQLDRSQRADYAWRAGLIND